MAIVYVTTGAWGTGTGTPNSAAQVDGNFYNVDQRIVDLVADLAVGKRIDTVSYTNSSMTFHFTDGTSQVVPLPVYIPEYVGYWANSTPYQRGMMLTGSNGLYQVLVDHTTPPLPAVFDPNADDGSTDHNPLYQLWMPLHDVNYDAAIFVPGSIQRAAGELLFQGIANRTMQLASGDADAYAWLDVGIPVGGTNIVISIQKNGSEIGTITFTVAGGQAGSFNIPALTDFAEADRYGLKVTSSANALPAGLSVTLPFVRTDI
jgi:hypothetical protein